jgi:hypothetical protein
VPLLLVQPAGGGKICCSGHPCHPPGWCYSDYYASSVSCLGADQANKVTEKASLEFVAVTAFHLDEIKDPTMQQGLLEKPGLLPPRDTTKSILVLFMSLQALHNYSCWQLVLMLLMPFKPFGDWHICVGISCIG